MSTPLRPSPNPHTDLDQQIQNTLDRQIQNTLDRQIQNTLDHLTRAQPSTGFETRLLAQLDAHLASRFATASNRTPRLHLPWLRKLSAFPPSAVALAASVLLCVPVAIRVLRHSSPRAIPSPLTEALPPPETALTPSPLQSHPLTQPDRENAVVAHLQVTTGAHKAQPVPSALSPDPNQPLEAQALADLHARSQPAPPQPLTAQELRILRMMRRGQGTQLADLYVAQDPAAAATERADFHRFFDPLPSPLPSPEVGPLNPPANTIAIPAQPASQSQVNASPLNPPGDPQ